jgi:spermidine synthase
MSCYSSDTTFFEIDPTVVDIARDPDLFTYLRECPARIVVGDGRQALRREPPGRFGLLAIDAFNSDAIPIHLITREAMELYMERVGPHGAVLFHISNRFVDLEPVLANIADDLGLVCVNQRHVPTPEDEERGHSISRWALLVHAEEDLGPIAADGRWHDCVPDGARTWTDDYSDLLGAMDFG